MFNWKMLKIVEISFYLLLFLVKNQRLLEQIGLYEVSNYDRASAYVQFFGHLCTIAALRDICRFMIGAAFGPYEPYNYYDVMY